MLRHHIVIGAPAVRQPGERAKPDAVNARAPEPVRRLQPPEEILLVAAQMVAGVDRFMIRLLIDQHAVQPERFQFGILRLRERLHFHLQRRKLAANRRKVTAEIVHAHFILVLTRDQQQVFKPERFNGGAFACNFLFVQRLTLDAVAH